MICSLKDSKTLSSTLTVFLFTLSSVSLSAQNIDSAVRAFQNKNYENAAIEFFQVLKTQPPASVLSEAQYGLAASFDKLQLNMAALKYYEDIAVVGSDHPYFDKAIEGLVSIAERVKDDFKIPTVIDPLYDANLSALEQLNPGLLQRLHFVLGQHALNKGKVQDALGFLQSVREGNPAFARSQYLLGLIRLGVAQNSVAPSYPKALTHFDAVRNTISLDSDNMDERYLRDLATLGIGRASYEQAYLLEEGDPERDRLLSESIALYRSIPRFSKAWPDSLFEQAWAYTVNNEYGKALGAIQSLEDPYFEKEFFPEARNLRAIIYYYNCQWDRVNGVVGDTKAMFNPLVERAERILQKGETESDWVSLLESSLNASKTDGIPQQIANRIAKDGQYKKMFRFLNELKREANVFQNNPTFASSNIGQELTSFALETQQAFSTVLGRFIQSRLKSVTSELSDITTRASLISLETKTAETEWLEQGRAVEGQVRKRLPRPFVPDETYQFWWYNGEHWIDELGFYEYTVKTECYE